MTGIYADLRRRMVDVQITGRGIRDLPVIRAMRKVPRELFVDSRSVNMAYDDGPLPIGENQTISQPYMVAYMTELLHLSDKDTVLEIGTGSGYQTAVLAEICRQVYTVEKFVSLSRKARSLLENRLGYRNVFFRVGDGKEGWKEFAPFDKIIVTAAPADMPAKLTGQMSDSSRMVLPLGSAVQRIVLLQKIRGQMLRRDLIHVAFVPLT